MEMDEAMASTMAPQKKLSTNVTSEEHIIQQSSSSSNSEKYIRKLDRLAKIYENMSEKNDRLRYRIVKVKEEINKLTNVKRHLCCRLSSFNDNFMDEKQEIPETQNRDANFEKLFGEIITNNMEPPLGMPATKKRKIEPKKVVLHRPKEVGQNSESPENRAAIIRILNDAKSLMKQEQRSNSSYNR